MHPELVRGVVLFVKYGGGGWKTRTREVKHEVRDEVTRFTLHKTTGIGLGGIGAPARDVVGTSDIVSSKEDWEDDDDP